MNLTLPSELSFWELEFRWIPKFLENNFKGQNSLESSWNIDAKNGLIWRIWAFKTQVMAKRKAGNQITNLTPNH